MRLPLPSLRSSLSAALSVLLLGLVTCSLVRAAGSKRRDPNIAVRFHSQVSTYDPSFAAKVKAGVPERELTVEKIPSLSERDVESFYPYKAADGSFAAAFQLDRHGAVVLETLSGQNRGRAMVVAVNARPIAVLTIDKKINDGVIYVPYGFTLDEIHKLGESFSLMGESENDKERQRTPKESTFSDPGSRPR